MTLGYVRALALWNTWFCWRGLWRGVAARWASIASLNVRLVSPALFAAHVAEAVSERRMRDVGAHGGSGKRYCV